MFSDWAKNLNNKVTNVFYLHVLHHPQYMKPNLLEGCLIFLLEDFQTFLGLPVFQKVLSISKTKVNFKTNSM